MTTPALVKANFIISGSPVSNILVYDKYKTKVLSPVILQVSNSSQQFAIQFYPTGSSRLTYTTFDEPPFTITKQLPYTLASSSTTYQSAVRLKVSVDSTGFDSMFDNSQEICSVKFNLVAITSSFAEVIIPAPNNPQRLPSWTSPNTSNTGGTNTGGTNTGGNNSGTTSDTCVCSDIGVCGEFCTNSGRNCATDADCISETSGGGSGGSTGGNGGSTGENGGSSGQVEGCGCINGRCSATCNNNASFCEDDSWCA